MSYSLSAFSTWRTASTGTNDVWYHIAVTWTAGNAIAFYVNGVATGTATGALGGTQHNGVSLACYDGVDASYRCYGTLAEVAAEYCG